MRGFAQGTRRYEILAGMLSFIVWGIAIEILCRSSAELRVTCPLPTEVLIQWMELTFDPEFLKALCATLYKLVKVILISVLVGYFFGFLAGWYSRLRPFLTTPLNAARAVPAAVLTPLFMMRWMGDDLVTALATFPSLAMVFVGVAESVAGDRESPRRAICRAIGMSTWQIIRHCVFWESLAKAALILVTALPMTVALIVALEYFDVCNSGLGVFVSQTRQFRGGDYLARMYAAILWVGLLGISATFIPKLMLGRFQRWMK